MDITHTFDGDLDIKLIAPSGTELFLAEGIGGSGDNFTGTVFMDGNDPINTGSAPFTGTYQPQGGTLALHSQVKKLKVHGLFKLVIVSVEMMELCREDLLHLKETMKLVE